MLIQHLDVIGESVDNSSRRGDIKEEIDGRSNNSADHCVMNIDGSFNGYEEDEDGSHEYEQSSSSAIGESEECVPLEVVLLILLRVQISPFTNCVVGLNLANSKSNHDKLENDKSIPSTAKLQQSDILIHSNFNFLLIFVFNNFSIVAFSNFTQFVKHFHLLIM